MLEAQINKTDRNDARASLEIFGHLLMRLRR